MGERPRATQAERSRASRSALLEAAARSIAADGYAALSLDRVAREAGYTRGALYHQFADKQALAMAVVGWVERSWSAEVGCALDGVEDPVAALLDLARRHARYSRRGVAAVLLNLRADAARTGPEVGREIARVVAAPERRIAGLVGAARREGRLPGGPPAPAVAAALLSVLEAVTVDRATHPYEVELCERAARGVLGLPPAPGPSDGGGHRPTIDSPVAS